MHGWTMAFHIIAVVCWFAALFYLPRLFVYHRMSDDTISIDRFKLMERKLYNGIAMPSMIATVILGFAMVFQAPDYYFSQGWFHAKLAGVALLIAFHFSCFYFMKQLANDTCNKSHRFFRFFNEVPVLFLVSIVVLVVIKPF